MRKLVPFLLCLCITAKGQSFTPGNIVVVKIGSGVTGSLSSGAAAPVALEEYKQDGTFVRSVALPTSLPTSGLNRRLTCNGASNSEGSLNISADGQFLTLCGYDADVLTQGGTALGGVGSSNAIDNTSPNQVNRVIGLVDYLGNINTTTALNNAYDKTNIRSAVTDFGSNLWICGSLYSTPSTIASAGIRYTTLGSTNSTKITNNNFDNEKVVGIFNDQLYSTSGISTTKSIYTIGVGMPMSAPQPATNLNGIPPSSQQSPEAFIFFDMDASVPGPDLLYIADDDNAGTGSTQGVNKYSYDGTSWTFRGRITGDCTGITGYINCNNQIVLFVTSNNNANNKIYKFIDVAVYNTNITSKDLALSAAGTAIVNAAGSNKVFRGIQMAPGIGLILTGTTTIPAGNYNKITIKNGANITLTGDIAIADKLVVESGATLNCGSFIVSSVNNTAGYFDLQNGATLKIGSVNGITATAASGNIQTCLRRFNSGGIYEYSGTAAQNTGDGLPTIISGKLTLNNAANITLSSSVEVNGSINFNAGKLQTSNTNLLTVTSSTQYNRYPINYLQTAEETSFIDGPTQFESNANTYQFLPIGKGSHFAPVGIKPFNNTIKTYTIEYFPATPFDYLNIAGGIDHISKLEYWDISCSVNVNPAMDAKITLYWSPNSVVGHAGDDANALPDLRITHYANNGSGLKWQIDNAGALGFTWSGNIDFGKISANDYATHFSSFTLASSTNRNLLPVQLLKFTALQTNNTVQLLWQTTNEKDMDYFVIEHSLDGQKFAFVKNVAAANKMDRNNYVTIDENPKQGLNFYRLVMVGKNGKKDYSSTEKTWMTETGKIMLYPNPAKDFIYVKMPVANGFLSIKDPIGKLMKTIKVDNDLMQIDVHDLAAGSYYVLYERPNRIESLKFMVR